MKVCNHQIDWLVFSCDKSVGCFGCVVAVVSLLMLLNCGVAREAGVNTLGSQ
jgi:hypothetical protein